MDIVLKKLTPELCDDFLNYFDHVAFADHEEWNFCYCLECHLDKDIDEAMKDRDNRRKLAREMVLRGEMQGYLAYDREKVVGWCNAGDKSGYHLLQTDPAYASDENEPGRVLAVYCYDIAPDYRGCGIAGMMLERVCEDAGTEGYQYVEAYPFKDANFEWQYHGTKGMYERNGFAVYAEREWFYIMRKPLCAEETGLCDMHRV